MNAKKVIAKLKTWELLDERHFFPADRRSGIGWRLKDLNLIQKGKSKLEKLLSKSPMNFNIYFLLTPLERGDLPENKTESPLKWGKINKVLRRAGLDDDIPKDNSAVNIVLTGLGEEVGFADNLPPTPWIITHWIAHGVMKGDSDVLGVPDYEDNTGFIRHLNGLVIDYVMDMAKNPWDEDDEPEEYDEWEERKNSGELYYYEAGDDASDGQATETAFNFQKAAFTFRSARTGKLRNGYEGWYELMAQYIIEGKVRLKKNLDRDGMYFGEEYVDFDKEKWKSSIRSEMKARLEMELELILSEAKGYYFIV